MDNLQITFDDGTPIAIKNGCPSALKSYRIKEATCYYAEVAPKQYMLFQNRIIGPFSIWLSDYLFKKPIRLASNLQNIGAEFHQMLEGSAMYSVDNGISWYRESVGDYNILMNGEMHTIVCFTDPPVRTFDVHVKDNYFRDLAILHPELERLVDALNAKRVDALFTEKAHSSLVLRYRLTEIIALLGKAIKETKACREAADNQMMGLLEECLLMMIQFPSKKTNPYNFYQADLEDLIQVKDYIADNFIHPQVLKQAIGLNYINKNKLTIGFKMLFGYSPKQYVIREKIDRAKVFMQEAPNASIKEIAMAVGYTDAAYFSQQYLKYEGMRIDDYRRLLLEEKKKEAKMNSTKTPKRNK